MSDYKDVIKNAIEKGFSLDTCGTDERHYSWGLYSDFCGMSVEDAKEAANAGMCGGGGSTGKKTNNNVIFVMEEGENNEYYLTLSAAYAPSAPVTVTFVIDGNPQTVIIPAGQKVVKTSIQALDKYKYAVITDINFSESDEYTFTGKNQVANGYFTLTITQGSETIVNSVRYGEIVTLPTVEEKEGYDFVWKDQNGNVITDTTFVMPESAFSISGNYNVKTFVLTYIIAEEIMNGHTKDVIQYSTGTINVNYGQKVLPLVSSKIVARDGYTASKWFTDSITEITTAYTMPSSDIEINAIYDLNQYTLSYYSDEILYSAQTLYYGETIDTISNPEKVGYTFKKWDYNIPSSMPASDISFNAIFTVNQYKVTVMLSEAYLTENTTALTDFTEYSSINVEYGNTILPVLPSMNKKEGYTFTKWGYIQNEVITPIESTVLMPAEDVVLYGIYNLNLHNVYYYINNVKQDNVSSYWYGQSTSGDWAFTPEGESAAQKTGYDLKGWYIDDNIDNKFESMSMPDNDLNVYTKYDIHKFTVHYIVSGETFEEIANVDYGTIIPAPQNTPEITGYTFNKWIGTNGETVGGIMPDNDVTFDADLSINVYTLTWRFADENDVVLESFETSHNYGDEVVTNDYENVKMEFFNKGYENVGHNVACDIEFPFNITGNTIINVTYSINVYNLTWIIINENDEEIFKVINSVPYGEELLDRFLNLSLEFYESHESTGHTLTPQEGNPYGFMPAEDYTITIKYERLEYIFGYYNFNKDLVSTIKVKYNEVIPIPEHETIVGYTFDKWLEYQTDKDALVRMPDYDYFIEPKYNVNVHTITFYNEDSTIFSKDVRNYGTDISDIIEMRKTEMPIKVGYTGKWDTDLDNLPTLMPDYDITVNILFTINQYEIVFYNEEGEIIEKQYVDYNSEIKYPEHTEKEGYEFKNWTLKGTAEIAPDNMPAHNIDVQENYIILSYKLTWKAVDENGVVMYNQSALTEYATPIVPPTVDIVGYTFKGWGDVPATMPNYDLTLTGLCTAIEYVLTYFVNGEVYEEETYTYGETITMLPDPYRDGYTFSGWNPQLVTMPNENVNVYGTFTAIDYTLTINVYDADNIKIDKYSSIVEKLHVGDDITVFIPKPEEIEGYTFVWDNAVPSLMPANNLIIEGRYTESAEVKTVYYSAINVNNLDDITESLVLSMNNFEASDVDTQFNIVIPADAQLLAWEELAEKAYEEGDDDAGDAYSDMITEYQNSNEQNLLIIAPKAYNYSITDILGKQKNMPVYKEMTINGCAYEVLKEDYNYQLSSEDLNNTRKLKINE